jgi:hypothetical protein
MSTKRNRHFCYKLRATARIPRRDYESFTDSWLAADKNAGGRTPHLWVSCADHKYGNVPDMSDHRVCQP